MVSQLYEDVVVNKRKQGWKVANLKEYKFITVHLPIFNSIQRTYSTEYKENLETVPISLVSDRSLEQCIGNTVDLSF